MFRVIGGAVVYGLEIYGAAKLFEEPLAGVVLRASGAHDNYKRLDTETGGDPGEHPSVDVSWEAGPAICI